MPEKKKKNAKIKKGIIRQFSGIKTLKGLFANVDRMTSFDDLDKCYDDDHWIKQKLKIKMSIGD